MGAEKIPHFVFCHNGINISEAMAKPTDMVEFYYMQAPAFEGFFGNLFKYLGAFHTAFGGINKSSGQNFTIEYDAMDEVLNATLPFITKNPDGSTNLTWYDGGGICVAPVLNRTYYSQGFQYVTTVNGSVFNDFLRWTTVDNQTYSEYELMYAMDHWKGPLNSTYWVNSSTCYDFNWRGMDFLYKNGAKLNYSEPMKHDFMALLTSPPQEVDYNDPVWHEKITAFYKALHVNLHDSWVEWLLFLEDLVLGDKFLHANGRYYWMSPMHKPYFKRDYAPAPLPG